MDSKTKAGWHSIDEWMQTNAEHRLRAFQNKIKER